MLLLVRATLRGFLAIGAEPVQKRKVVLAVDNYGGFSHGGRRISVFADGSYEDVVYTDVVGSEKERRGNCAFDSKAGTLTLDSDKKDGERLFRTSYDGKEYWVHKDEVDRIKKSMESRLRQTSLRNKR